ncbi:unnamed protein product [Sphenostylis stenocarpa]|uniref:Uncharacterized protein n=1 Tax=Sphenostylis stenocarpa TaxID=92480 RepID=A0AA86TJV5_9FABA|nr:unnamed protein product [Sphenostylis stenocarpa]
MASSVLGADATLKVLYMKLLEAVSGHGNNEHREEAALFCIQAMSKYVSTVEAEVMPRIMALLPKLPHQPQLLQTTVFSQILRNLQPFPMKPMIFSCWPQAVTDAERSRFFLKALSDAASDGDADGVTLPVEEFSVFADVTEQLRT